MDRFDLRIEVPAVRFQDLTLPASGERSHVIANRVLAARALQNTRYTNMEIATNSDLKGDAMDRLIQMDDVAKHYLEQASNRFLEGELYSSWSWLSRSTDHNHLPWSPVYVPHLPAPTRRCFLGIPPHLFRVRRLWFAPRPPHRIPRRR